MKKRSLVNYEIRGLFRPLIPNQQCKYSQNLLYTNIYCVKIFLYSLFLLLYGLHTPRLDERMKSMR